MNRDFKGVWIPKEIWLNENLTLLEKVIFVEIDSLDNENHCTAGNEYFATFCDCSESKVSKAIKKLKELNMVEELSFDGRHRKLRVVKNDGQDSKKYEAESQNLQANNIDNKQTNKKELLSKDNNSTGFQFGKQKPKKDNLYTKCVSLISDYTQDVELYSALVDYLKVRLEMKDKPLYSNSWKGLLNKLDREFDANDRLAVVRQSIERGYASFFPVNNNSRIKSESGSRHVPRMTDSDYAEEEKMLAELEAKGVRTRF